MKKLRPVLFLAVLAIIGIQTIKAQTVDEIVNRYVDSLGGAAKIQSLRTLHMEGSLSVMGNEISIVINKSNMIGQRTDITAMGVKGFRINTPTQGWAFLPFQGQDSTQPMSDEEVKAGATGLDLQGNLFNYKEKGSQIELQGKDTIDKKPCYKLKETLKSGKAVTYWIDTRSFHVIRSLTSLKVKGQDQQIATTYSDYRKTAEGFIFPFTTTLPQGDLNFTKIEANVPVDPSLFKP